MLSMGEIYCVAGGASFTPFAIRWRSYPAGFGAAAGSAGGRAIRGSSVSGGACGDRPSVARSQVGTIVSLPATTEHFDELHVYAQLTLTDGLVPLAVRRRNLP
jgi:hypothetical protein